MKASICALSCLTEVKDPLPWGAQELPRIGHRHASAVANGGHHAHRTRSLVATARQSGCQGGARQPTCSKPRRIGAAIHAKHKSRPKHSTRTTRASATLAVLG